MWMINFRVRDLNAMTTQLRNTGIAVEVDPQVYSNGRFARLHDPEDNPLELWEPAGRDALEALKKVEPMQQANRSEPK
jgi:predicted enzyme related to lactoylglutathione lyase